MQKLSQLLLLILLPAVGLLAQCPEPVWSDEFDGDALSLSNWNVLTGDGCDIGLCGWGNSELQSYQSDNIEVSNGSLKITARRQNVGGSAYTSARITTKNKQDFKYGYMEARIKLPEAGGLWPAFWMLSTDEVYGGWPRSGEIDIMEWVANNPEKAFGTIHFGQAFPNNQFVGGDIFQRGRSWAADFHTFAIDWQPNLIRWYVDGYEYSSKRPGDLNGQRWPFDQDFHFILNVAVGGTLGGAVTNADFPSAMEVDYVRVYDTTPPLFAGPRDGESGTDVRYSVRNVPEGSTIVWTGPEGSTVTPNGTAATVTLGDASGRVDAEITTPCGTFTIGTYVNVQGGLRQEYSFENFDDEARAVFEFASGDLTEVDNPAPDAVNPASLVGRYVRDGGSQFDVIVYQVNTIEDAGDYLDGSRAFSIMVYTAAPIGSEILLQLETSAALPENYPTGRHSRFVATTTVQNQWERINFNLLDEPDAGASGTAITKMVLLIEPNTNNADTYFYDNLDSYFADPNGIFTPNRQQFDLPVAVMPNPTSGQVTLDFELPTAADYSLRVFDGQGRQVQGFRKVAGVVGQNRLAIDLGELPNGVYLASLAFAQGTRTIRLVKR